MIRFDVKEHRIGISPGAQAGPFQTVIQADGSSTRKYRGNVWVPLLKAMGRYERANRGYGTPPRKRVQFMVTVQKIRKAGGRRDNSPQKLQYRMTDVRVVVAMTRRPVGEYLRHQILSLGKCAGTAANGTEALESFEATPPQPTDQTVRSRLSWMLQDARDGMGSFWTRGSKKRPGHRHGHSFEWP